MKPLHIAALGLMLILTGCDTDATLDGRVETLESRVADLLLPAPTVWVYATCACGAEVAESAHIEGADAMSSDDIARRVFADHEGYVWRGGLRECPECREEGSR